MIYGFMQQTNGNVRIQSEPGRGTTIKLFLRRCLDRDGAMPVTPILAGTALRGGSETVLVVEDDESVRLLIVDDFKHRLFRPRRAGWRRCSSLHPNAGCHRPPDYGRRFARDERTTARGTSPRASTRTASAS